MEGKAIHSIIFDLDDTLIKTSKIYHHARNEFSAVMSVFGFPEEEVLEKLDEIDIAHITQQGFVKERYPFSLIKTYRYYSMRAGKEIDPEIEKKIEAIGWKVFQQKIEPVEGYDVVLKKLKFRYFLILATLGDPEIQNQKITQAGLQSYFSAIYVLSHKTVEEYKKILTKHQLKKEETWLIGNSVRSDLNPGLRLGLNCILIPAPTWKFEEQEPVSDQYMQLKSLSEVLDYL